MANLMVAQIKPSNATTAYHAIAHGDAARSKRASQLHGPAASHNWIASAVGCSGPRSTIDFYVDGVLHSAATAPIPQPRQNRPHSLCQHQTCMGSRRHGPAYYAHIAALDGVSTIGRVRAPQAQTRWQALMRWVGSLDAAQGRRYCHSRRGEHHRWSAHVFLADRGQTGPAPVSRRCRRASQTDCPSRTLGGPTARRVPCAWAVLTMMRARLTVRALRTPVYSVWALNRWGQLRGPAPAWPTKLGSCGIEPRASGAGQSRMPDAEVRGAVGPPAQQGARRALADVGARRVRTPLSIPRHALLASIAFALLRPHGRPEIRAPHHHRRDPALGPGIAVKLKIFAAGP